MKIKKGDQVQIMVGKNKGKTGKVLQVFDKTNKIVIEGQNLLVKSTRPRKQGEKGQLVQFPAPLNASNVMLLCPKCGRPTKIGYQMAKEDAASGVKLRGKKFRQCKKCKQTID